MNVVDVYKTYIALHSHFSSKNYDYEKYEGRVRASLDSYEKRNDRKLFKHMEKLTKREFLSYYLTVIDENRGKLPHILEIIEYFSVDGFVSSQFQTSIYEIFRIDCRLIASQQESLSELIINNNNSKLFSMWLNNEIQSSTLILLNEKFSIFRIFELKLNNPLLNDSLKYLKKLKTFFTIEPEKINNVLAFHWNK